MSVTWTVSVYAIHLTPSCYVYGVRAYNNVKERFCILFRNSLLLCAMRDAGSTNFRTDKAWNFCHTREIVLEIRVKGRQYGIVPLGGYLVPVFVKDFVLHV